MTTALDVSDLDFDTIKQNFKNFLSNQSEFQDYDFEGSAMSTLLDVMAYGIHYTGVHANMALTESDMLAAQVRKNVVSGAKSMGYIPASPKGAKANFTLTLDLTTRLGEVPTVFTVKKGTNFSAIAEDGSPINFTTFDDNTLTDIGISQGRAATKILSGTVFVVQGEYGTQQWTKDGSSAQRFILTQPEIDTDFLQVTVQPAGSAGDKDVWTHEKTLLEVGPDTESFFLSEVESQLTEVYFGNNQIGKAVTSGSVITAEYITTQGSAGNNLSGFTLDSGIGIYPRTSFSLTNHTTSSDGSDRESIESIKHNAPLDYQRQNRVVVIDDYKAIILKEFPNITAINAWGGEDAVPPQFGKVFVSVKPSTGKYVSPATKKSIERDVLGRFNVVGITPELVDPDFIEVNFKVDVNYNKDKTTLKASEIETQVLAAIINFLNTSAFDYEQSFKYSKMMSVIDNVHRSIINNYTTVTASKEILPLYGVATAYSISFNNAIIPNTLSTGTWARTDAMEAHVKDDGRGAIDLYLNGNLVSKRIGTVDYSTGQITFPTFNPMMQNDGDRIRFTMTPLTHDINIVRNDLLILGATDITAIPVKRFDK